MERNQFSRLWIMALACGVLASVPQASNAFWPAMWRDCTDHIEAGRQVNQAWPYPYVCPDRIRAHAPFDVMVRNGWRRQNLLGEHHYNEESTQLTRAGELKVRWIMTQAPEQYRQVYVERSMDPSVTEQRLETARQVAQRTTMGGGEPIVRETHILSRGRPATSVAFEQESFRTNMRPATLGQSQGDAAAASGN